MSRPLILAVALGSLIVSTWQRPCVAQDEAELTPRVLAPGVLTVVEPEVLPGETFTRFRTLGGIDANSWTPNEAPVTDTLDSKIKKVIFRHDVWCYEFAYKPLRMIYVDVPQPSGKMQRKVVWYLVYRVRNLGDQAALASEKVGEEASVSLYEVQPTSEPDPETLPNRFFPRFVLEGWAATKLGEEYSRKEYLDRVIPVAISKIQQEEDPAITFHDSVGISAIDIPAGPADSNEGVWGVATWEDIDPRIDYVSVFVQGLSNAFQVSELADGGQEFEHKTLQLNFWRPGDTLDETRDQINVGIPMVDSMTRQIEITERYGLPGPVLTAYRVDTKTGLYEELFEVDGMINEDLDSKILFQLQAGEMPTAAIEQFARLGINVPETIALNEETKDRQWSFTVDANGQPQDYRLRMDPKFWEKVGRELHFLRRLEYQWLYR